MTGGSHRTGRSTVPAERDPDDLGQVAASIRERVLAGWAASPVRFREDANAEEDYALGGYRDRVLVELAQNAADAAARAGVPGRLLFALRELDGGPVLVAANTGAELDAAGVQSLSTLRASSKRDGAPAVQGAEACEPGPTGAGLVGRFGVGFSAVLAVTDEPAVLSRRGGVRFSREDTHDLVTHTATTSPELAAELARRDGHVPVLRLPFAATGEPPTGYDTVVLLPVRDGAADDLVRRLLADLDDALLLALPQLGEVRLEVDGAVRVLAGVDDRWFAVRRTGLLDARDLGDRPVEERSRTTWSLTWALPRDPSLPTRQPTPHRAVVHAPTPTDEPLGLPGLLIASFPLDPSRRHVAPGPATDALAAQAGRAYAELVAQVVGEPVGGGVGATSPDPGVSAETTWQIWDLVPTGLPAGALDAAVQAAAVDALRHAAVLHPAEGGPPVRPRDAVALAQPAGADLDLVRALAPSVAGLIHAPRSATAVLETLGVHRMTLADLIDQLPLGRTPGQWRELYGALAGLAGDSIQREAMASLPVPLADGRVVRGVRGVVLAEPGEPHGDRAALTRALADLGVRTVHPDAVHPMLERLGARHLAVSDALGLAEVRAAVEASLAAAEDGDLTPSEAVLTLVEAALADGLDLDEQVRTDRYGWLGQLALLDAEGEIAPAAELVLPGSAAERLLDPEVMAPVEGAVLHRWGAGTLQAVGVLADLALVRAADVDLGDQLPESLADLPDVADWLDTVRAAVGLDALEITAGEVVAVRDLDAVREDAWPELLDLLARDPALRRAVVTPLRLTVHREPDHQDTGDRVRVVQVPSWTAWWVRRELFEDRVWADPQAQDVVRALLEPPPMPVDGLDVELRRALGGVRRLSDLDAAGTAGLLVAIADEAIRWDLPTALQVWGHLARVTGEPAALPSRLPALRDGEVRAVDRRDVMVVDDPVWLQREDLGAVLVVARGTAAALAELLDLPMAADLADGRVRHDGAVLTPVPDAVHAVLPQAPESWWEHEQLLVDGVEVDWWVAPGEPGQPGQVHAATLDGLARGLAWSAGTWGLRSAVAALLEGSVSPAEVLLDEAVSADGGLPGS